ncbi:hypothetical protein PY254_15095 [Rhodanobacter sp. AS-Z3]|uniref:hypothetical protein n=1 Tax=Rhodanobacter sp. AS-Z3 TaxID=3031330 RepID=UPI00247B24AA|nr:hypothetical protein [Rhodanobacter sp. AS-Z3]WEN14541.1 hypothetical protein PY254_15095 [Rhodanobacter sp. AS-Z3]
MTKLRLEQAPIASLPRRFLLTVPLWGVLAGLLLIVDGDAALRMRWQPATLALVHVFTLGVLGNAMFGSILQFLPAAGGVTLRGGVRCGWWLHGLLNLGALLLVIGMHQRWPLLLLGAAMVLALAFVTLAWMVVPGLLTAVGQPLLRAGFGTALAFALATAVLGCLLALGLAGQISLPLVRLADVHASWGVLGWVVVLMASVARVVMPMFQGTGTVPVPVQAAWLAGAVSLLGAGAWWHVIGGAGWLAIGVGVLVLLFAGAVLWLQWRSARLRRGPLVNSWRAGMLALALAAVALPILPGGMLAGALGLGLALPLLVIAMLLEIVPFIGWIELHRQCGRGVQVPGVQRLLPDVDKHRVLLAHVPLLLLPMAVIWPSVWLARMAGVALVLLWGLLSWTLLGVRRRANHFLRARR